MQDTTTPRPDARTIHHRRLAFLALAASYLRAGDASLRHHAALFLAALRRRQAVRP